MNRWGDESDSSSDDEEQNTSNAKKSEKTTNVTNTKSNDATISSTATTPAVSSLQQQLGSSSLNDHQRVQEEKHPRFQTSRNRDSHNNNKNSNSKQRRDRDDATTSRDRNTAKGQKERQHHAPQDWKAAAKASSSLAYGAEKSATGETLNGGEWMANRRLKNQAMEEEAAKAKTERQEQLRHQKVKDEEDARQRRHNQVQSLKQAMQKIESEKKLGTNQQSPPVVKPIIRTKVDTNAHDVSNTKVSSLQAAVTSTGRAVAKQDVSHHNDTNSVAVTIAMPSGVKESYNINTKVTNTTKSNTPQRHQSKTKQAHQTHSKSHHQASEGSAQKDTQTTVTPHATGGSSLSRVVQETGHENNASTTNSLPITTTNTSDKASNRRNDDSGNSGRGRGGRHHYHHNHHHGGRGKHSSTDNNIGNSPKTQPKSTSSSKTNKQHIVIGD